jgi:glycerophosphoinositol glycerophosphodiesterase
LSQVIGFCLCLFSYIRLPPPSPLVAQQVLGPPPSGPEDSETCWEVAHRAAGLDAPENSLEAVRLAASNGAKWVEFDVSFTSDGTAVAFHDDTLERVTTGSGPIADTTFSQLGRLDLATRHPLAASFQGVRIPTVKAFVAEVLRLNMKLVIDLKTYQRPDETVALVRSLYQDLPALRTNALVTSFFPQLLYRLRAVDPDIVCSLSTRPYFVSSSTYDGTDEGLRPRFTGLQQAAARGLDLAWPWLLDSVIWWVVGISALLVHKSMVTRQFVLDWRRRGVRVMAWTVNSPLEKAVMRRLLGVQVLTDTLDRWAAAPCTQPSHCALQPSVHCSALQGP